MPGWQAIYDELKDKNFEIISVAEDTRGVQDAGPWITEARPSYTVLIDQGHLVTRLYNMVNVPTGVWIDERGRIVRPGEVAYVDERFRRLTNLDPAPYLNALRDWAAKGAQSAYAMGEDRLRETLAPQDPDRLLADAEFGLGEHLYQAGRLPEAIPHFKKAQALNPDSWNYKRQAWALSDSERDYGTTFRDEVQKMLAAGKKYYAPIDFM